MHFVASVVPKPINLLEDPVTSTTHGVLVPIQVPHSAGNAGCKSHKAQGLLLFGRSAWQPRPSGNLWRKCCVGVPLHFLLVPFIQPPRLLKSPKIHGLILFCHAGHQHL